MRLLIMGPPGAGKGTQGVRVAKHYGVPAISTGEIFRQDVRDQTPLGVKIGHLLEAGEYVPDALAEPVVVERLSRPDVENGFLLDGFPRTAHQIGVLDETLADQGTSLVAVISLVVDPDAVVERMLKRARTQGRADDNGDTIRRRQAIYTAETSPILAVYRERGLVCEIDGNASPDDVFNSILEAVAAQRVHE